MTQERPAPEQYLAFPEAIAALRARITRTTDREIACWIFFDQIKAYSHVHEFPEPPEFNLAGLALSGWPSASKEYPPFITALEGAFFRIADVEDFTPPARYIAFADLLQRWMPHRESQEATASFIHSRIHQSRLHDFAPWLGETELSRVFFPSLPDDWARPRPPAEWAMFDLAEVEAIEEMDFPASNPESSQISKQSDPHELQTSDVSLDRPALTNKLSEIVPRKLNVMFSELMPIWPNIENDVNNGHKNGLRERAKLPQHGKWNMAAALEWAIENRPIKKDKAASVVASDPTSQLSILLSQLLNL